MEKGQHTFSLTKKKLLVIALTFLLLIIARLGVFQRAINNRDFTLQSDHNERA